MAETPKPTQDDLTSSKAEFASSQSEVVVLKGGHAIEFLQKKRLLSADQLDPEMIPQWAAQIGATMAAKVEVERPFTLEVVKTDKGDEEVQLTFSTEQIRRIFEEVATGNIDVATSFMSNLEQEHRSLLTPVTSHLDWIEKTVGRKDTARTWAKVQLLKDDTADMAVKIKNLRLALESMAEVKTRMTPDEQSESYWRSFIETAVTGRLVQNNFTDDNDVQIVEHAIEKIDSLFVTGVSSVESVLSEGQREADATSAISDIVKSRTQIETENDTIKAILASLAA